MTIMLMRMRRPTMLIPDTKTRPICIRRDTPTMHMLAMTMPSAIMALTTGR